MIELFIFLGIMLLVFVLAALIASFVLRKPRKEKKTATVSKENEDLINEVKIEEEPLTSKE